MGISTIGVVNDKVVQLVTDFTAKYLDALSSKPDQWGLEISGFTPTDALQVKFPVRLDNFPGFRKWSGARDGKLRDLTSFFVNSEPFERTIDVPLDAALRGEYAGYFQDVTALRQAAAQMPNRLIADLLAAGESTTGWDGVSFFSASHPIDIRGQVSGVQSNLHGSKPLNRANLAFAKKTLRAMKAPDGRTSLGLKLTHLLVPTALEDMATRLAQAEYIPNVDPSAADKAGVTESNIHKGTFKVIVAPELDADSDTTWYPIAANQVGRGFEIQARGSFLDPEIVVLGDGSEHAVQNNTIRFAGKLFGNAGFAIHHCILRMKAA